MTQDLSRPAFERAVARLDKDYKSSDDDHSTSIIEALVRNESLAPEERSWQRCSAEAGNLIGAGTETTARTLSVGLYHILANPAIHEKLLAELRTVMPDTASEIPSVVTLSQLPYLTACIHESTRVGHGVAGRLVRIAPEEDISYGGFTIPRGTTFSMSHYIHHRDPAYFPDPESFVPERYLTKDGKSINNETLRYLVPFSKGPRMCLGMNLAWSEMYLAFAYVLGTLGLDLFETTDHDVEVTQEYFIGLFPRDSKGLRVKVLGKRE